MKRLITLFFVILIAGCAMAQKNYDFSAECESGQTLYYEITSSAKPYTVEVVSELNNRLKHYNTYPTGNIIIPQYVTYNGEKYSVTRIGIGAFGGCSGLTSITIPNSVTIIGDRAFSGCTGLTSIIIPESVTIIKNDAFAECSGLSSISIPNSVTSIGSTVFNNTAWYNTQPDGILILDGWCVGYKGVEPTGSLTIQEGIKGIANRAFIECSQLTSISIPNTTKIIGEETFYNCSKLTSISIPNSVTSIGERAFSRCNGLISVTIPKSVTNIGEWAFGNVLNVIYDGNAKGRPWGARTVNGIIDDGFVFSDSKKTNLVAYIGDKTDIAIPNSVTSIGNEAFSGCSRLTSVTIPNSVTEIGNEVFDGCNELSMIKIPYSVTYIGYDAFYNTAWYNNQPNGILYLDGWCLGYKEEEPTGSLTIQEGTKGIANGGFEDCSGLTSVTIPNSTTTIGNRAFFGCTGLRSISIPNSVKNIGDETFTGCEYLDQISVKKILKINKNVVFEW